MKLMNVVEENNENIVAGDLKRGDIIFATKAGYDTAICYYEDYAQNGGYCFRSVSNGKCIISGVTLLSGLIQKMQDVGYKVKVVIP